MKILIFGGTGFVGLNIAATLLARGHAVTLFDRASLPAAAHDEFAGFGEKLAFVQGDVTDRQAVTDMVAAGHDAIVLGAAVTAGPLRESTDPESIVRVNLLAHLPILTAARGSGARIVNLSSAAVYGTASPRHGLLDEETACEPQSLYAITKLSSEKIAARMAALWNLDLVNVRLSGVFGPWERPTGVRDTLSPQAQILDCLHRQSDAILPRPGVRDWIYAPDVAEAVTLLIEAARPRHALYNISTGQPWPALQWGARLAGIHPGFVCRLGKGDESASIDLHSAADRAPMSVSRLQQEFGWRARFGCDESVADLDAWWMKHGKGL